MEPKFNIDRPKIGDEEIKKHQNFEELVNQFKKQSLKQARGDESWRKNKRVQYAAVIAGITVVCTVTLMALFKNEKTKQTNETLTTKESVTAPKKTNAATFINPPSKKLTVNSQNYKVNNAAGAEIRHPSSSKIRIPKNSFVDKSGRTIVGDVTIEYREFHDPAEVILSGIPMTYDSAGHRYNFETAGMFEIKGSQNGEPVFISPDKKVDVELASFTAENRFNQYYLDTISKNWTCLKRDKALPVSSINLHDGPAKEAMQTATASKEKPSPKLEALKKQIEVVIPKQVDSVKVVYEKKVNQLPKYKEPFKPLKATPKRPTFRLDGSYNEFPELSAFKDVVFEVGPENNNYNQRINDITWSDVKISEGPTKGVNYILTLTYRQEREKLIVYPILGPADFQKATDVYNRKFEEYEQLVEKRNENEKRLIAEMQTKQEAYLDRLKKKQDEYEKEKARLVSNYQIQESNDLANNFTTLSQPVRATRLFRISQFGVFNSDCPHATPDKAAVNPVFTASSGNGFVNPDFVYLVDHSRKIVYTIASKDGLQLNYDPANIYSICIFNHNKLFICNKSSFSDAVMKGSNKFPVVPLAEGANSILEFRKALEI